MRTRAGSSAPPEGPRGRLGALGRHCRALGRHLRDRARLPVRQSGRPDQVISLLRRTNHMDWQIDSFRIRLHPGLVELLGATQEWPILEIITDGKSILSCPEMGPQK